MIAGQPLSVLLLEDRPADAALILHALRRAGFAPAGQRVDSECAYLAALDPALDVILADYSLPQFDAPRALRLLRDRDLDVPFIIVSGSIGEETAAEVMRDGAADYLLKDRLGRLGEAVRLAISQRRLRRDAEQAADALRASEARFRALVQNAPDLIAVLQADGAIQYVSPAVEPILGYSPGELVGANGAAILDPTDESPIRSAFASALAAPGEAITFEGRLRHRNGSVRWIEAFVTSLVEEPAIGGLVLNARDVTDRKRVEEQLAHRAFHDTFTGLPNRALFVDRLEHALTRAQRQGAPPAVLCLDLDHLRVINDSLGRATGDEVVRGVAACLKEHLRQDDTLAHFGGDEFAILLDEVPDATEAIRTADRLVALLRQPHRIKGRDLVVGCTIGIALGSPQHRAADLLREADDALSAAKARHPGGYALFDPSHHARAVARLELEDELRRAIERAELRLHYQPIVDLASGNVIAVEALVRWQHPRRGLVGPGDFLRVAEETGLIVPIGAWVIAEACRQLREWQRSASTLSIDGVSVNLAAAQLHQTELVTVVERVLCETGVAPAKLRLEITEQILVEDLRATAPTLGALRGLGVRLAIDDFGVGYSSLGYLRELDADTLKIDRSFVQEIGNDEACAKIVRAVGCLAHDLGMKVTAEGIETDEQWAAARIVGCDNGQGFRFARPVPPTDVMEVLATAEVTRPAMAASSR